jgi:omega-6 fatty acid desaturase (delta-12 desaturase)
MSVGPNDWKLRLNAYKNPSDRRAAFELAVTALPLAGLWAAMWLMAGVSPWLPALLAIPSGALLVRLFMIQHDCGHNAFFSSRLANDWTGRVLGVLTLTPFDFWRHSHALHHAGSGNLGRRGIGDIDTLTVEEYLARGRWGRIKYRLYRHPLVMFGLGPSFLFLLQHRLPVGATRLGRMPWLSTMLTNLGIALLLALAITLMGLSTFLLLYLPMMVVGASIGVWLFYVQHQFEETHWETEPHWDVHHAALHGSSHYVLPQPLQWMTANLGMHHVHHLYSRLPFYRLPEVLRDFPPLAAAQRMTIRESLINVRLHLWDENGRRLLTWRQARALTA